MGEGRMSLIGKRIVITRAKHQADGLANLLRERGAIPIFYPCIAIIPPADVAPLDNALSCLSNFAWLLITSTNTVEIIHQRLSEGRVVVDWDKIKIGAVGDVTANAFYQAFNKKPDFIPSTHNASQLGWELPILQNQNILLPQSALAKPILADILTGRGAVVTAITAYQTVPDISGDDLPYLLARGMVDAVTFTSPSAVRHFVIRVGYAPDVLVVCMSASIAQTAREMGFVRVLVAEDTRLEGMIGVLENYFFGG